MRTAAPCATAMAMATLTPVMHKQREIIANCIHKPISQLVGLPPVLVVSKCTKVYYLLIHICKNLYRTLQRVREFALLRRSESPRSHLRVDPIKNRWKGI